MQQMKEKKKADKHASNKAEKKKICILLGSPF